MALEMRARLPVRLWYHTARSELARVSELCICVSSDSQCDRSLTHSTDNADVNEASHMGSPTVTQETALYWCHVRKAVRISERGSATQKTSVTQ